MTGPRLTPEQKLARRAATKKRMLDLYRLGGLHHASNGKGAVLDEGEDPMPMTQHGENRLRFSLGDGCNQKPSRKPHA